MDEMPEMRITLARAHFGALCSLRQIGPLHDVGLRNRLRETGAPVLTIEFIERTEERFAANTVHVNPCANIILVCVTKRTFGPVLACQPTLSMMQPPSHVTVVWNGYGGI